MSTFKINTSQSKPIADGQITGKIKLLGKAKMLSNFTSAALLSLLTFMPLTPAIADDTEIYTTSVTTGGPSNLLFMLDYSGSMRHEYKNEPGGRRYLRLQRAMVTYLRQAQNVNIGIGVFKNDSGESLPAIVAPVRPIDQLLQRAVSRLNTKITSSRADASYIEAVTGKVERENRAGNDVKLEANKVYTDLKQASLSTFRSGSNSAKMENGLIFQNLGIPQGSIIKSARLTVTAAKDARGRGTDINITAQAAATAPLFSPNENWAIARQKGQKSYNWKPTGNWSAERNYKTGNIKEVIQEVINRSDWCGGNNLALFLSGVGNRSFYTIDDTDTDKPPQLEITYDTTDLAGNQGCMARQLVASVEKSANDTIEYMVEDKDKQKTVKRYVQPKTEDHIELGKTIREVEIRTRKYPDHCTSRYNPKAWRWEEVCEPQYDTESKKMELNSKAGFRFEPLKIPKGAAIKEAYLLLTGSSRGEDKNKDKDLTLRISVDNRPKAPDFQTKNTQQNKPALKNRRLKDRLANQASIGAPILWEIKGEWENEKTYRSVDIKQALQPLLNKADWRGDNNNIVVVLDHGSSIGRRVIKSYDDDPANTPKLIVKVEFKARSTGKRVREELIERVMYFRPGGQTPLVRSLLESGLYYAGKEMAYGGQFRNRRQYISHQDSFKYGKLGRQGSGYRVFRTHRNKWPTYIKPADTLCGGKNTIVLLTDGQPVDPPSRVRDSKKIMQKRFGVDVNSCMAFNFVHASDGITYRRHAADCGVELTAKLYQEHDIKTVIVGFGGDVSRDATDSSSFISKMAAAGDEPGKGKAHHAMTDADLLRIFKAVESQAKKEGAGSFVAPTVSVNAFNRLVHRSEAFLSMFEVADTVNWSGNVKKFGVCDNKPGNSCKVGELLDKDGKSAVDGENIKKSAKSHWLASGKNADGDSVKAGGTAGTITSSKDKDRNVYTYVSNNVTTASLTAIMTKDNKLVDDNDKITPGMLGMPAAKAGDKKKVINWIRGQNKNGSGMRWPHGDPLHSSPIAFNVGGSDKKPVIKMVYGTNDGGIRLINTENGKEEWVFYPRATLKKQYKMYSESKGDIIYGIDGSPTVWVHDKPSTGQVFGDGVIDKSAGEFVKMYIGMRRGGRNYYALDITPPSPLQESDVQSTNKMQPSYMWRIQGGSGSFAKLGQSWSTPKRVKVQTNAGAASKNVLIFGGGYDTKVDNDPSASATIGNAIYIVDALNGNLLWWMSGSGSGANVEHASMQYAVPSDVAVIDSNNNGYADRIYVGDVHGQIWRVDLGNNLGGNRSLQGAKAPVAKLFANISNFNQRSAQRAFFYEPQIVSVKDKKYSTRERYDIVFIQSGFRPSPLSRGVQDRLYAIRDYMVAPLKDKNNDGIADIDNSKTDTVTITENELFNTTNHLLTSSTTTGSQNIITAKSKYGYYFDLPKDNKGITVGTALFGVYFFNVYSPDSKTSQVNQCQTSQSAGESKLYAVDILSGLGVVTSQNGELVKTSDISQRDTGMGTSGLPGGPSTTIVGPDPTTIIRVGPVSAKLTTANNRFRTYWSQGVTE